MRTLIAFACAVGLATSGPPAAIGQNAAPAAQAQKEGEPWQPVRAALGHEGKVDQGVLRVNFVGSDLGKSVTIDGSTVKPGVVYQTWFGFMPMPGGQTMMMGDLCLKQTEVAAAQRAVFAAGFEISGLHNHVLNESSPMVFMHISGDGDLAKMSEAIKTILATTATPTGKEEEEEEVDRPDWSAVCKVFGAQGEAEGNAIEFAFPRADPLKMNGMPVPSGEGFETANEASFISAGNGQAIVYIEFLLKPSEVTPTLQSLVEAGLTVQAVHNHMISEEPRLIFVHAWGRGEAVKMAEGVKSALSKSNVAKQVPGN